MAFLKTTFSQEVAPVLRSGGVALRPPAMADYAEWAELRTNSRHHLEPWEPAWAADELTRWAFRRRIRHYQRESRDDQGYAFFIVRADDDRLIGGLTLSNVRRGVTQAANLGYWLGEHYCGRGHMTTAVTVALGYAFDVLRLHRVEAACMLANTPSMGVLGRTGFTREGLARRYLRINGVWQDHALHAVLSDDPRPSVADRGRP